MRDNIMITFGDILLAYLASKVVQSTKQVSMDLL